jgi:hypothetical protein
MSYETDSPEARREYAAAYAAHYSARDLPAALQMYRALMASHPNAREAEYSRMQIDNIVQVVVPRQDLLDAETMLALARFDDDHPRQRNRTE